MNTFWLKIAGVAVGVVLVIFLISFFRSGNDSEPKEPQKTLSDVWDDDEKRLRAEPTFKEEPKTSSPAPPPSKTVEQTKPPEQPELRFKKLNEIERVQAEKLWEWVMNQRKMGRLPVMGYGQMVKTCRDIIQKWPQSKYAFQAKRALADLPPRYHKMYNITKEEIDLGNFK